MNSHYFFHMECMNEVFLSLETSELVLYIVLGTKRLLIYEIPKNISEVKPLATIEENTVDVLLSILLDTQM